MSKKLKEIPKFANEDEDREFWLAHDTTDYFDHSKSFSGTFPNLKMTTQSISLRLSLWVLDSIKITAHAGCYVSVAYQGLVERKAGRGSPRSQEKMAGSAAGTGIRQGQP
jgi:predicted DNA binding CopG/RHH family protein